MLLRNEEKRRKCGKKATSDVDSYESNLFFTSSFTYVSLMQHDKITCNLH